MCIRDSLIGLHQLRVHLADSGALGAIEYVFLRGAGVTALHKDLFDCVLYLLSLIHISQ